MAIFYTVKDESKNIVSKGEIKGQSINENSSKNFLNIKFDIPKVGKTFSVNLRLEDRCKKILSKNDYTFLIGSQENTKERCKNMKLDADKREKENPGFYRYFPELWNKYDY